MQIQISLTQEPEYVDLANGMECFVPPHNGSRTNGRYNSVTAFGCDSKIDKMRSGTWEASVASGYSVNCDVQNFCPHCSCTHTECVGHITKDGPTIMESTDSKFLTTAVLVIEPELITKDNIRLVGNKSTKEGDFVVTEASLLKALEKNDLFCEAQLYNCEECGCKVFHYPDSEKIQSLIICTFTPNAHVYSALHNVSQKYAYTAVHKKLQDHDTSTAHVDYTKTNPCYMSVNALQVQRHTFSKLHHLVLDMPSMDREDDGGLVEAHWVYFGPSEAKKSVKPCKITDSNQMKRVVTELAWFPLRIKNERFGLLAPNILFLNSDAAPSGPIFYPAT